MVQNFEDFIQKTRAAFELPDVLQIKPIQKPWPYVSSIHKSRSRPLLYYIIGIGSDTWLVHLVSTEDNN